MSPYVPIAPKTPRRALLFALVSLAMAPSWAAVDGGANPTSMTFSSGGTIRIKLNKGDVEIVGVQEQHIRVSWDSKSSEVERSVKVRVQRSGDREASVYLDGPGNDIHYRIEVPRQSDVAIHMRAGELDVRGILGSMDVDLMAGQMDLRLVDPARYRSVNASVIAGELDARPWRAETAGLWRSFRMSNDGTYDLRARLIAGQLTIHSE